MTVQLTMQNLAREQTVTIGYEEFRCLAEKISWLDAWKIRKIFRWSGMQTSSDVISHIVDEANVSASTSDGARLSKTNAGQMCV